LSGLAPPMEAAAAAAAADCWRPSGAAGAGAFGATRLGAEVEIDDDERDAAEAAGALTLSGLVTLARRAVLGAAGFGLQSENIRESFAPVRASGK
jgi:hypothetical protein